MSFQKGTSDTTNTTSYPQYVEDAQKAAITAAGGMAAPWIKPQNYAIAGQNLDQQKAAELARTQAEGAFNTDYSAQIARAGNAGYGVEKLGNPALMEAAKVDKKSIVDNMNPYLEGVGRSTLSNMRREHTANDAQIGARAASGVAFGGSGPAIARGQANRAYGEQVSSTIQNLMAQGYSQSQAIALANASAENAARAKNMDATNRAAEFNANAQNDANKGNAALNISSLTSADQAYNNTYNRQQGALSGLMGIGDKNQAFAQANIDLPWTMLNRVSSMLPGVAGTETESTPQYFNPLEALVGLGSIF
jgi:uncharacterized protein YoaH (UPF0181 family)